MSNVSITVQSWMLTERNLSGYKLLIFAIVYAPSQIGSFTELEHKKAAAILGIERSYVTRLINEMIRDGYLEKKVTHDECGKVTNLYRVVMEDGFYPTEEELEAEREEDARLEALYEQGLLDDIPEPEPAPKPKAKAKAPVFDLSFIENDKVRTAVGEWLEYKQQRKEVYASQLSVKKFHSTLMQMAKGDVDTAVFIIDQAISNNWQGIHETREMASVKPATERKTERVDIDKLIKETEAKIRERQRKEQENKKVL